MYHVSHGIEEIKSSFSAYDIHYFSLLKEIKLVRFPISNLSPRACFSKFPKLFGPISDATVPFISSQRRGSKASNLAFLFVFHTSKNDKRSAFQNK